MFQVLRHGRIPAPRTQGRLVVLKRIFSLACVGILFVSFVVAYGSRPAAAGDWIMAGAVSGYPVCPAQCLVVNDTLKQPGLYRGQNVGFTPCTLASSAQIWSYDNSSQTISVLEPYSGMKVCLTAQNFTHPVSSPILTECVIPTPRSQLWRIDARNASILSISSLPAKFLGSESAFSYVNSLRGFSWRNAVLATDGTLARNRSGQIMMSFVPVVSALNLSSASPPDVIGNLINNGSIFGTLAAGFLGGGCVVALVYATLKSNGKRGVALELASYSSRRFSSQDSTESPSASKTEASPTQLGCREYSLKEIDDATMSFCCKFREGSGGIVYAASLCDGRKAVVKRFKRELVTTHEEFMRDVELLRQTRHTNLVTFLGFCKDQGECMLLFEHMSRGTLHHHLHGHRESLMWNDTLQVIRDVAAGLEFLHHQSPPILHRNLSSKNVLLTDIGDICVAKLMDFGLVRHENPSNNRQSSAGYMEARSKSEFSTKSDVYSFGVLLLEILTGREAFHLVDWARECLLPMTKVTEVKECLDKHLLESPTESPTNKQLKVIIKIVKMCILPNVEDRPSMEKVTELLQM